MWIQLGLKIGTNPNSLKQWKWKLHGLNVDKITTLESLVASQVIDILFLNKFKQTVKWVQYLVFFIGKTIRKKIKRNIAFGV